MRVKRLIVFILAILCMQSLSSCSTVDSGTDGGFIRKSYTGVVEDQTSTDSGEYVRVNVEDDEAIDFLLTDSSEIVGDETISVGDTVEIDCVLWYDTNTYEVLKLTVEKENALLANIDIDSVEKMTITSGGTGESIDITNPEDIEYITNNINSLDYTKGEKVNGDGWSYMLRWYNSDGEIIKEITLLGSDTIIFDGYYYRNISDGAIDISFLEEQFTNN